MLKSSEGRWRKRLHQHGTSGSGAAGSGTVGPSGNADGGSGSLIGLAGGRGLSGSIDRRLSMDQSASGGGSLAGGGGGSGGGGGGGGSPGTLGFGVMRSPATDGRMGPSTPSGLSLKQASSGWVVEARAPMAVSGTDVSISRPALLQSPSLRPQAQPLQQQQQQHRQLPSQPVFVHRHDDEHPRLDQSGRPKACQQSQQSQQQQHRADKGVAKIATLVFASMITYVLYHATIEALAGERLARIFFLDGGRSATAEGAGGAPGIRDTFHYGRALGTAVAEAAKGAGGGKAAGAAAATPTAGFSESVNLHAPKQWGRGVSVITVSAWQSLAMLGAGFVVSRFWKRGRRAESRALSVTERARRNRCLLVFATAHLLGTGLEYHGYGVIGPLATEILRSTETACFCLLSLVFGMQRPGIASVPTLLLALGLALAATPASGEFRVGWEGLRASPAANILLAIRAIAAKTALDDYGLDEAWALFSAAKNTAGLQFLVLLAVEVPRAASGLPPRLLPHLWGVGIGDHDGTAADAAADAAGMGDWDGAGLERARLALLLLANGLCLYGNVLALFGLLSRLSATAFAISSGYLHACLVFVLLLSLKGSATGTRSTGMALATFAVVVHVYRAHSRGRITSSPLSESEETDVNVLLGHNTKLSGGADGLSLPRLPTFLRTWSPPPGAAVRGNADSRSGDEPLSSPGSKGSSAESKAGSSQPPALFVPLLGTRHGEPILDPSSLEAGVDSGDTTSVSPSRFAWRWMGLRPSGTPTPPSEMQQQEQQQQQRQQLFQRGIGQDSPTAAVHHFPALSRHTPASSFGNLSSLSGGLSHDEAAVVSFPARDSADGGVRAASASHLRLAPPSSLVSSSAETSSSRRTPRYLKPRSGPSRMARSLASAGSGGSAPGAAAPRRFETPAGEDVFRLSAQREAFARREGSGPTSDGQGLGFGAGVISDNRSATMALTASFGSGRGPRPMPSSPTSSSSFSLNGFEVIDKEDMWN